MIDKLLPFHVSGPWAADVLQVGSGTVYRKIAASAGGRFDRAQVRFKITEAEALELKNEAERQLDGIKSSKDDGRYRLARTVLRNATRALEMFEEQRPAPFVETFRENSAEKLADYQSRNNMFNSV